MTIKPGIYKINWKDNNEGSSLAAIGCLHDGTNWFAPTNWTAKCEHGIACIKLDMIESVEFISFN